jgi:hypothetical protein
MTGDQVVPEKNAVGVVINRRGDTCPIPISERLGGVGRSLAHKEWLEKEQCSMNHGKIGKGATGECIASLTVQQFDAVSFLLLELKDRFSLLCV